MVEKNTWGEFEHLFPKNSIPLINELCKGHEFKMVLRYNRSSKLGDFRSPYLGKPATITVNGDINPYFFLITFVHEFAHLLIWEEYKGKVRAHGKEWKNKFTEILMPFANNHIFPDEVVPILQQHLLNPKASSHADPKLYQVLRNYNHNANDIILLRELEENKPFKLESGRKFIKGKTRRSRILCRELNGSKEYLIHGYAEVFPISEASK